MTQDSAVADRPAKQPDLDAMIDARQEASLLPRSCLARQ